MIDNEFGDDLQPESVRLVQELLDIIQRPVTRIDTRIIGDVITIILQRRRHERQQPDRVHPKIDKIFKLLGQSFEISHAVIIAIKKCANMHFVDDCVFVPKWVVRHDVTL